MIWDWKQPAHINILESMSYVGLMRHLLVQGGDRRFNALLDSRAARGAHAKGRSSARALKPSLPRSRAYAVAGICTLPWEGFASTRVNTADAPTRQRSLPEPAAMSMLDFVSLHQLAVLHSYQFSRGVAGWIRLFILMTCICPDEGCWTYGPMIHFHGSGFSPMLPWIFHLICCLGLVLEMLVIPWAFSSRPWINLKPRKV